MKRHLYHVIKKAKGCNCAICQRNDVEGWASFEDALNSASELRKAHPDYDWCVVPKPEYEDDDVLPFGIGGYQK